MYDKFQGCTVDVQAAKLIIRNHGANLHYVHWLNVCHDALHYVSVMVGRFQTVRVNVYAHALNLSNQYLSSLLVYKLAAWSSTLHTVFVRCTTSLRVVQLM